MGQRWFRDFVRVGGHLFGDSAPFGGWRNGQNCSLLNIRVRQDQCIMAAEALTLVRNHAQKGLPESLRTPEALFR